MTLLRSDKTDGIWGTWSPFEFCPPNQHVYGYRLKSQSYQTDDDGDNTALNSIELHCMSKHHDGGNTTAITGGDGMFGEFSQSVHCEGSENPVVGFKMQIESACGACDDTAANNVILHCKRGADISANVSTNFGAWSPSLFCPPGHAVSGISTRVEGDQFSGDDTSLNGVSLQCSSYTQSGGNYLLFTYLLILLISTFLIKEL